MISWALRPATKEKDSMSHHGQNPFDEKHSELMRKIISAEQQITGDPLRDMQR